jgi:hypothetical protein
MSLGLSHRGSFVVNLFVPLCLSGYLSPHSPHNQIRACFFFSMLQKKENLGQKNRKKSKSVENIQK